MNPVYTFSEDIGMEFGIKKCGVKVLKRKKLIKLNTEVWISQMRSGENNLGWYLKNSNENLLQGAKQSGFWSSGRVSQRKLERENWKEKQMYGQVTAMGFEPATT